VSAEPPLADPDSSNGDNTPAAKAAPLGLDQRFDAGTLCLLRAAVLAHADATGMPEQCARDVVLSVHELAANVIQHGTGAGRLVIDIAAGTLRCTVEDAGAPAEAGHTKAAAPDGLTQSGSDCAAGPWPYLPGHGLWLVREVAHQMTVADLPAGSQVTAAFLI
jgi:anti-sigma regulatory factor (Ser/Thr protein kinase)